MRQVAVHKFCYSTRRGLWGGVCEIKDDSRCQRRRRRGGKIMTDYDVTFSDMGRGSNWPGLLLRTYECQTANVKWLNLISLLTNSGKRVCRCVWTHICKFVFVFSNTWNITTLQNSDGVWLKFWNITNITYITYILGVRDF